jgi:hypothetical protein
LRTPSGIRPSFSSRLSFAISNAEEEGVDGNTANADQQINEEIEEIKRYEVSSAGSYAVNWKANKREGLHHYRYEDWFLS